MINFSYKSLLLLYTQLGLSSDPKVVPVRQAIYKELDSVPQSMVIVCLRADGKDDPSKDIHFLTGTGIEEYVRGVAALTVKPGYAVLVHCPHKAVAGYVFDQVARLNHTNKINYSVQRLELANGAIVQFYSGKQTENAVKGSHFDVGLVLTYEGIPSA